MCKDLGGTWAFGWVKAHLYKIVGSGVFASEKHVELGLDCKEQPSGFGQDDDEYDGMC